MGIKRYSLQELSDALGIEPRTIRWYISEGLLKGPESLGRGAYYTAHHLKRLQTIKELKETYGMPLREIRRYITMAGDEDIQVVPVWNTTWHEDGSSLHDDVDTPPAFHRAQWRSDDSPVEDAYPVEKGIRGKKPESIAKRYPPRAPIIKLLDSLRELLGEKRVPRSAKAETVTEIGINPEITLRIKGEYQAEELALFEQLADHLRELLLGGEDPKHLE